MITDATVGDLLLEELLQPASAGMNTAELNAVVDGFPRTAVQVCKQLCSQIMNSSIQYKTMCVYACSMEGHTELFELRPCSCQDWRQLHPRTCQQQKLCSVGGPIATSRALLLDVAIAF